MISLLMFLAHPLMPSLHWALSIYFSSGSFLTTSLVPTSLVPTSLVPTSLVPTSLVPTSLLTAQNTTEQVLLQEYAERRLQGDDDGDDSVEMVNIGAIVQWAASLAVTVCVFLAVAFCYKSSITDKRNSWPANVPPDWTMENGDWKYGTFSCFNHIPTCLYGCCCISERLGDNANATGIGAFWTYVAAWLVMYIVSSVLGLVITIGVGLVDLFLGMNLSGSVGRAGNLAYYIANIILAYWLARKRRLIRKQFGDKSNALCMDFMCYWCCGC